MIMPNALLQGVTVPNLIASVAGFILVLTLSYAIYKGVKKLKRSWPDFCTETLGNGFFLIIILGLFVIGSGRNLEGYEDGDRKGIKITELENKVRTLENQLIAVSVKQYALKQISPADLKELATANKSNATLALKKYHEISQSKKTVKMFYNEKTDGFLFSVEDAEELKIGHPMPLALENQK